MSRSALYDESSILKKRERIVHSKANRTSEQQNKNLVADAIYLVQNETM